MIIKSKFIDNKKDLPSGKLSARWVFSRGTFQVYLGGRYLSGVSGETKEQCQRQLQNYYNTTRTIEFK